MPDYATLAPSAPWRELRTTRADWDDADPATLESMLVSAHLIRAFEEKVLDLAGQGLVHGPAHSAVGQEGGAVGSAALMRAGDQINGSHRAHHQFLAKSIRYVAPDGLLPAAEFSPAIRDLAQRSLAEILGLAQGFCRGRGGSMHLRWAEAGNLGTNAIVGGGVPLAAGAAWAQKRAGKGDVAFA
ncbi:MFS transporter, partial [Mesorhizobium sp. M2C.T.Ca.TU.009.01.2.1]